MSGMKIFRSVSLGVCAVALLASGEIWAQGRTVEEAAPPSWEPMTHADADAPSILLVMTDDVGFGSSSTFGGPVETPVFDALAQQGLRYNTFTTTGICSPTRAALLTGRNHHAVNVGTVMDVPTGYDGYTSVLPKSAATAARLLTDAGYGSAMFGKGHITPLWEIGPTGPFDRWPTGLGFQYFYGFLSGDTNQWAPTLIENTVAVEAPEMPPEKHLDGHLADKAIDWISTQRSAAPNKPLFVYYSTGTAHAPHHAPPEWMAKYRGHFDAGWDVTREQTLKRQIAQGIVPKGTRLAPRPDVVPAWETLTDQQKRVYAREMEAFAAALSYADHEIGRVVDEMRRQTGGNLLVVFIQGDNGASAEGGDDGGINEHGILSGNAASLDVIESRLDQMGGPYAMNTYPAGWALAMNTPFPWFKQLSSHFGSTRNGMVVSWPERIEEPGGVRSQYVHVTDIMPTLLEAAHIEVPEMVDGAHQQPVDGISFAYSFNDKNAPSRHRTQYFAIWDNMGIYHDGWVAASVPERMPWQMTMTGQATPTQVDGRQWELFNLETDFSQSKDISRSHPERLEAMRELFFAEAGRADALPLHRFEGIEGHPRVLAGLNEFTYLSPVSRIPEDTAPRITGNSYRATAELDVPANASGVILSVGGRFGGMSWYLDQGKVAFHYNLADLDRTQITSATPLEPGKHELSLVFDRDADGGTGATVRMFDGDELLGEATLAKIQRGRFTLDESFEIGSDTGTPVTEAYQSPNDLQATISEVRIKIENE
ncbi:arylsulfatase [Croceicoccus sediminis]|uniref:arylsulfatase n=1 Tax=Croceicoccus sediminis TaxID=2571150 RepID=UPI001F105F7D|nr:arylsulfatase [Croceicoccus sediminis]